MSANTLEPGHYVTTDFLRNDSCVILAGPFPTQDEARAWRTETEEREGHHLYFLEEVRGGVR